MHVVGRPGIQKGIIAQRDRRNMGRYEEYGDRNYPYNPYKDYSAGWVRNNMPHIPNDISGTHPPSQYQLPRKPPCHVKENEDAEENRQPYWAKGWAMGVARRKSEATANLDNGSTPHHHEGGKRIRKY